ncbi:BUD2-GTPase-activating for Bud1p Rsr1p [Apiospora saccharicola]|uniref:BUD2-GTPase-activating for Bud1p Rsr1p n=1 Tax=Apiospora saccharicola TaxID=335842 RepID=A0ABR1U489_9PEZI
MQVCERAQCTSSISIAGANFQADNGIIMRSLLPPGMDGRTPNGGGAIVADSSSSSSSSNKDGSRPPFPAAERSQASPGGSARASNDTGREREREKERERSSTMHGSSFIPTVHSQNTIRTVTPEPAEKNGHAVNLDTTAVQASQGSRGYGITSPQTSASPRSIPGGESRRQGIVFNDAFGESYDDSEASPQTQSKSAVRPRTHTMDGSLAVRQQANAPSPENRHRVGSFSSSSGSTAIADPEGRPAAASLESVGYPSIAPLRSPADLKISISNKDKRSVNKRLVKRASSRPTSPLISPPPSVDSLPLPIPTDDANKVLLLMKTLCGRMKGQVEYQSEASGPWHAGVCYIDEERGSLLFDPGQNGPFHLPIVGDLRGCRVLPVEAPDGTGKCLELSSQKMGVELLLKPVVSAEVDFWLAALLCWQQVRPSSVRFPNGRGTSSPSATAGRPEMRRRGSATPGFATSKDAAIIKVGKVMLWDKGVATSPRSIVKRPSTRDLRGSATAWRRVSCILQDNGEFKLMTENDVSVLSIIELSQLSRCAVQQLDKSVLDEDYCIAIFPIYSATSKQLSIFRPVYIALDTRVLFEVWFVLLRAFAVPDLYGLEVDSQGAVEITDFENEFNGQMFRLEKTIQVRVTEAKLKKAVTPPELNERQARQDRDALIGNYLAEVILDGEVRARTTTQPDTKNPFWREAVQFTEVSSALPYLSVVLKRVDGNLESFSHQLQASLGLPKTGNLTEVMCGAVDISLDKLNRAKDHEQWLPIHDEKNESIGTMFVKVNHDELVVLMAKDYKPLSALLHKFSVGLTGQIAAAMPQQLRRLAEIFLNIFQVSNSSVEWLLALVEEEIDGVGGQNSMKKMRFSRRMKSNESTGSSSDREALVRDMGKTLAGEANLLFRGNSLLTQALEFHMRRLGKEYLEDVLSDKIFEINEINPDCEVDPSRIQNGDDLDQHWAQLTQITTEVWECIAESANRLPAELRQILKYVRAVAEDRYGDFLRTVTYTSVSGFLFLRFICPAILNPKLFGLLRDNPRHRAQRTLTLVAKGLQALGNLSTFGRKEGWMEPMNKFLNTQRQPFKEFIDAICYIPTERAAIASLPATYMAPVTILGRLSPIAREGFPALPYLIDHPRNFSALVKLWLESHHPTEAESNTFEGELAEFHELCVMLQKRSDECLNKIEVLRAAEEQSIMTDDFVESLEKSSFIESASLSQIHSPAWVDNDPYRAPGSSGSEQECERERSLFRELKFGSGRHGQDSSSSRQASDNSEVSLSHHLSGTLRRNGKLPRNLFGLIGSKKSKGEITPTSSPGSMREKHREDKDKGFLRGISEGWQKESGGDHSRH